MDRDLHLGMLEAAPVMLWRAGPDGQRDHFNARWLSFRGRSLADERGRGWTEGLHPDDANDCLATMAVQFARRRPFELEYRLRGADGAYRRVRDQGEPFTDPSGAFAGFVGACLDLEGQPRRALPFATDDFFEHSLDCLCVAGLDGYIKHLNPAWTRTLGWSAEEILSRPSIELVHPDDREATLAGRQRLREGGHLGRLVNRYLCKDGGFRWFEWRSVTHDRQGLVYAAARDVTEQKLAAERLAEAKETQERLQRQLYFADRMASVGTLAAGVAHEINNPLAAVTANVSMILDELEALPLDRAPPSLPDLLDMAADIASGAERIRKIVGGLSTFSRLEDERRVVFEVHPVIELAAKMTDNEIRHRARLVRDFGALPPVEGDDARLAQVFINLLINAAQALPEGDAAAHEVRVVTRTDAAGHAAIEVRDTGCGIDPAVVGRIFDPFFTTKAVGVGTGLGLSICHNIVRAMQGRISVDSQPGHGTTFRVVLPPAQSSAMALAPAPSPATPAPGLSASILVVDDEVAVGRLLARILRDHDVTTVTSARDALELLVAGRRYDLIVSDLMMPEMSGMDFFAQLETRWPALTERVAFITGGAFTPAAQAFIERVPNPRLYKPFTPQQVRELVQTLVPASAP